MPKRQSFGYEEIQGLHRFLREAAEQEYLISELQLSQVLGLEKGAIGNWRNKSEVTQLGYKFIFTPNGRERLWRVERMNQIGSFTRI